MLRIHAHRFAGSNAKKERIKRLDPLNKGRLTGIHLTGHGPLRVIVDVDIPTRGGHGLYQINPVMQQLPEGFGGIGPWKATGHADDGNWFSGIKRARR